MNTLAFLALGSAFSFFLMSAFVLCLDRNHLLNRIFAIYAAVAGIYCFVEFGYLQAESLETAQFWIKARSVWVFVMLLALHFHLIFTERFELLKNKFFMGLLYSFVISLFFIDVFTYWITGPPIWTGKIWSFEAPTDSILFYIGSAYPLMAIFWMLGLTYTFLRRTTNPVKRRQIKQILIADILVVLIVLINTFVLKTAFGENFHIDSSLGLISNLVIVYAIWKYNLMRVTPEIAARNMIDSMSNFMVLVNPNGVINQVNPALLRLTGYRQKELEGKPMAQIFPYLKTHKYLESDFFYPENYPLYDEKSVIVSRFGQEISVLYSVSPSPENEKGEHGYMFMGHELTEQKKIEHHLMQYKTDLGKAYDSLEGIEKIISSELFQSLRVITSYAELGKKQIDSGNDKSLNDYLNLIAKEGEEMYHKLTGLIEYSVVERQLNYERINVKEVVEDTLLDLKSTIDQTNTQFLIGELPTLVADKTLLSLLFKNLISNSLKFNDKEMLVISIQATEKRSGLWEFAIEDNGIGIDPSYHYKIFQPNYRVHSPDFYPGLGMGLSLSKQIVEKHKGNIGLSSEIGKGTVIYFTLASDPQTHQIADKNFFMS